MYNPKNSFQIRENFYSMETISPKSAYSKNKLTIILVLVGFFIFTAPIDLFINENLPVSKIISILSMIFSSFLIFAWCHYDALERNQPLGGGWRLLILLLGVFALLIYLLKTRGFKQGLFSIGFVCLIFIGIIVGSMITTLLAMLITGANL